MRLVAALTASTLAIPMTTAGAARRAPATTGATATPRNPTPGSVTTVATSTTRTSKIVIRKIVTGSGESGVTAFVADLLVSDARVVRGAFAENKFGTNIIAKPSAMAAANDALLAINGDYYGFRDSGIVIRNGVIFRDVGARPGLALYRNGTMKVYDEKTTSATALLADGVWSTLSFGPALLRSGEIPAGIETFEVDTNPGNHSVQGYQPRTGVGMIAPNHFVFVVVDGRSKGYSRGVTMTEFATLFRNLGANVAYNLDGGGSATMWFDGSLVNNPLGRARERGHPTSSTSRARRAPAEATWQPSSSSRPTSQTRSCSVSSPRCALPAPPTES